MTFREDGPVEFVSAASADHCLDIAGMGIDGYQCALRLLKAVLVNRYVGQFQHGFFSRLLHAHVNTGINFQAFFINRISAIFVNELGCHIFNKIGSGSFEIFLLRIRLGLWVRFDGFRIIRQFELNGFGFVGGCLIEVTVLHHLVQYG